MFYWKSAPVDVCLVDFQTASCGEVVNLYSVRSPLLFKEQKGNGTSFLFESLSDSAPVEVVSDSSGLGMGWATERKVGMIGSWSEIERSLLDRASFGPNAFCHRYVRNG